MTIKEFTTRVKAKEEELLRGLTPEKIVGISLLDLNKEAIRLVQSEEYDNIKQEFTLTMDNTEELYTLALEISDFKLDNNQVSNLTSATIRNMMLYGSLDHFLDHSTTHKLKTVAVTNIHLLQQEARA